jgi:hypothetical protein
VQAVIVHYLHGLRAEKVVVKQNSGKPKEEFNEEKVKGRLLSP